MEKDMEKDFFKKNQVATIQKVENSMRIEDTDNVVEIVLTQFPELEIYIGGKDNYYMELFFHWLIVAKQIKICWCKEEESDANSKFYIASRGSEEKHYCKIEILWNSY